MFVIPTLSRKREGSGGTKYESPGQKQHNPKQHPDCIPGVPLKWIQTAGVRAHGLRVPGNLREAVSGRYGTCVLAGWAAGVGVGPSARCVLRAG